MGNALEGKGMLWDVWMVDELGIAKVLLKNIGDAEWAALSNHELLFRVPSGFLLGLLKSVDDLVEVN